MAAFAAMRREAWLDMEILLQLWWLIPTTFFTGVLTAVTGAGGGVLLLGLMGLALPPTAVVPVHGAVMLWQNASRLTMLYRLVDWRFVGLVALGSVVGAVLAGPVAVHLNETAMQVVLGLGLLYLVWAPKPQGEVLPWIPARLKTVGLALVTSMVTMIIGAAGVLFAAIRRRSGRAKEAVLADQSAIMLLQHGLKVGVFGLFGFAFGPYLPLLAAMALAGLVGTWVGVNVLRKISNAWFDHAFRLVVSIVAGILLARAAGF
ncbi:MAG: TSUP family transporter [Alphaproteobacteria bacterium]|nr:TSUP family transporter [Alphaproteobacteria bacterium]